MVAADAVRERHRRRHRAGELGRQQAVDVTVSGLPATLVEAVALKDTGGVTAGTSSFAYIIDYGTGLAISHRHRGRRGLCHEHVGGDVDGGGVHLHAAGLTAGRPGYGTRQNHVDVQEGRNRRRSMDIGSEHAKASLAPHPPGLG